VGRIVVALALCGPLVCVASCAAAPSDAGMHMEAVSVCGTPLGESWGGGLTDLNRNAATKVSGPAGQPLLLETSSKSGGCARGDHITWAPRSAARLVKVAKAQDGLVVAIVLVPTSGRIFTVTASAPRRNSG
jgi:hypothetical protein